MYTYNSIITKESKVDLNWIFYYRIKLESIITIRDVEDKK